MTIDLAALEWRKMSREEVDRGLNNGAAVAASADIVADWEKRSAGLRQRHAQHLDLRYGPRERNRIDFLRARDGAPTLLFIHGGYWQNRAKEVFTVVAEGPMAHGINVALIGYTLAPDAPLAERPTSGDLTMEAAAGDVQYLLVLDRWGNWIDTLLWRRSNEQYWRNFVFNLNRYIGSTIMLQWGTYNNGWDGVTAMYVDDVSLRACP
jgi:hypothetical protein